MNLDQPMQRLLTKCPFFGRIAANIEYVEDKSTLSNGIPTFATDGEKVYYHPDAVTNASLDKLEYLLGHEIYHIAYSHLERRKDRDPETWNIAADAVANAFLKQEGIVIPENSVNEPWAIDYSVEEVYEEFKDRQQQDPDYNMPEIHDIHYEKTDEKEKGNGQEASESKKKLQEEIEKFSKMKEKEAKYFNDKEKKENLENLRKELVEKTQHHNEADSLRQLKNIGTAEEEVDWRSMLANSIVVGQDWSFLIPEIEDDILKPQLIDLEESDAEILVDTSGSVDENLLRNFLRECKNILHNSEIKIGCFDDEFYGFQKVATEEDIDTMILSGGGGTDFDVAVNAFTERATNMVIFTDGRAMMPQKHVDAIWLVYGGKKIAPPGGTVIPISEKQYNELRDIRTTGKSR